MPGFGPPPVSPVGTKAARAFAKVDFRISQSWNIVLYLLQVCGRNDPVIGTGTVAAAKGRGAML